MKTIKDLEYRNPSDIPQTEEEMIRLLENAKAQGDDTFFDALGILAKAKGMTHISQQTGLNRENLYRSLKPGAKPRYNTIEKVLSGFGIKSKLISKDNEI